MKPEPETLYKYRSLSGDNFKFTHDIFLKNELYFPHPDQINDPFDCKIPPYTGSLTKEKSLEHLKNADPKRLKDEGIDLEKYEENISITPLPVLQDRLKRVAGKSQKEVGVLSFSQKNSDILMWGHYADSHRGICIGFDYHELSFTFRGTPIVPEQVKYPESNEYAKSDPFEDDVTTQIDKTYFTKSREWDYEEEWRVIFPEHGRTLQRIDPNALVSVHLGCQIADSDRETVINWCLRREQKPRVWEMTKDDTSYSLRENEISY